ncbi:MAG: FCD domain-containing protein, partial [Rhodoferax sp.]|nr:FCD domain-containing protein [Rhodoferax sp.]
VTELDSSELRELMEVRAGLFEIVIRKLTNGSHPEFLPMLKAGTQRLHSLANLPDDGGQYAETTYRLLILFARMAGNKRLQRMLTGLSLQTLRYSKLGLASAERRIRSATLWQQAADAQEAGNTELVVSLIHRRINESAEEAIRVLDQKMAEKGAPV